ncbi:hypothetical protein HQ45_09130 [Porphyromonas crevioricanis]|uniref:Late embryogenesis abundant protein n=2 Tax=Porphyromonas crevioricanis TaxID=393921 RepID=A0A0A2FCV8_9PORP|nr:hypothetical protein [Porphyromonas crevioricanis]KGN88833.1 hypothetical protein HQ45_09130 [Porphyromonas crevioricanis]KGN95923.1 hypothetical protein HQ38_02915 [Porphyromonas crevioricanis]SJZ71951.1 hypothetical protein SAMN02745203_00653 [Porphyromonas crevioricanis]SQH73540.1 Uncharacterised protein [Porphyromonas crevioricanis]
MKKFAWSFVALMVMLVAFSACSSDDPTPRPNTIPKEIAATGTKALDLAGNKQISDYIEFSLDDFKELSQIGKENYGWIEKISVDISSGAMREFNFQLPGDVELSDVEVACADQTISVGSIKESGPVRIGNMASEEIRFYETILNEVAKRGKAKISFKMNLSKPMISIPGKVSVTISALFSMRDEMK